MFSYVAFGLRIHSVVKLPELVPAKGEADVIIRLAPIGDYSYEDGPVRCVRVTDDEIQLAWGNVATVLVQRGREVIIDAFPGVEERLLRLLILGPALGVLLHQRGLLVLHASTVAIHGSALAFLGWKGAGKSTMAAALYRRGHTLISDDLLVLDVDSTETPIVRAGFPQFKLWPDAVASLGDDPEDLPRLHPEFEKRAHQIIDRFSHESLPLRRIYILDTGAATEMEALPARLGLIDLVRHSYAIRFLGTVGANSRHFRQCVKVASEVPVYRLKRPNALAMLPELARLVEENLTQGIQPQSA